MSILVDSSKENLIFYAFSNIDEKRDSKPFDHLS